MKLTLECGRCFDGISHIAVDLVGVHNVAKVHVEKNELEQLRYGEDTARNGQVVRAALVVVLWIEDVAEVGSNSFNVFLHVSKSANGFIFAANFCFEDMDDGQDACSYVFVMT